MGGRVVSGLACVLALILAGCTYNAVPDGRTPIVAPLCIAFCDVTIREDNTNTGADIGE